MKNSIQELVRPKIGNRVFRLRRIVHVLLVLAILLLVSASSSAQENIRFGISSQETYVGVPVTLSIAIRNAKATETPEIPEVDGMDIRSAGVPNQSSRISIINGRRMESRSVTYNFQITPRREGTFEIPSFTIATATGKSRTEPIRIVATKSETGDLLFAEITGQKAQLYVGQPIELTLKIWIKPFEDSKLGIKLSKANMFRMLSGQSKWGAFESTLSKLAEDQTAVRVRDGLHQDSTGEEVNYYLYEIDATFYPKRAGQLDVEDVQIVVNYPTRLGKSRDPFQSMLGSSIFGGGSPFDDEFFRDRLSGIGNRLTVTDSRPIVATPDVAPIEVVPIPTDGRPADYRGTVGKYRMITQAAPQHVKAGDPINLQIGINGTGPMELVQAPPLSKIESLTADFKVTDGPLAGVVQGENKFFSTSIRPRREGITQIPAIPFSFFDSEEERFVTVYSDPISIQVDKAEKLALDSIVGSSRKPNIESGKTPKDTGPVLENFNGRRVLENQSTAPSTWFWLSLMAAPPVVFGLLWLWRTQGEGVSGREFGRRATVSKISRAVEPRDVSSALLGMIANRLERPTFNLTRPEAVVALSGVCESSTIEQLDRLLIRCENASFAAGSAMALDELKSEAHGMVRELARVRPVRASSRIATIEHPWKFAAATLFQIFLIAATVWSLFAIFESEAIEPSAMPTQVAMLELDTEQKATLLQEASAAYDLAMESKSTDAAEANQGFAEAAQKYQTLVDAGAGNYRLFFNLGNAYLQSDSIGRAIANYQRASKLQPFRSGPRRNLEFAQQLVRKELEGESMSTGLMASRVKDWFTNLPESIWLSLLAMGWVGIWIGWMVKQSRPGFKSRYALAPAAILLLVVTGWVTYGSLQERSFPAAVVVANEVQVYQGSSEAFPVLSNLKIQEGDSVEVLQRRGEWLQFRNSSGQEGWTRADGLEQV